MQASSILVIDDDPITCEVLGSWCTHFGAACTTVLSISDAEARLAERAFDIVLCDVHLPGNRSLAWVRQLTARRNAPVVVLITGNPELESTLAAANIAVAGYLVKPLDFATLGKLVQRLVDERRRQSQLAELSLSASQLLAAASGEAMQFDPQLQNHLREVGERLHSHTRQPRITANDELLRRTVAEAVDVLEKTKHNFRSKQLGDLRRRLQQSLASEFATA